MEVIIELIAELFATTAITKRGGFAVLGLVLTGLCIGGYFLFR